MPVEKTPDGLIERALYGAGVFSWWKTETAVEFFGSCLVVFLLCLARHVLQQPPHQARRLKPFRKVPSGESWLLGSELSEGRLRPCAVNSAKLRLCCAIGERTREAALQNEPLLGHAAAAHSPGGAGGRDAFCQQTNPGWSALDTRASLSDAAVVNNVSSPAARTKQQAAGRELERFQGQRLSVYMCECVHV